MPVGPDHQAEIPLLCSSNSSKMKPDADRGDRLCWSPAIGMDDDAIDAYLERARSLFSGRLSHSQLDSVLQELTSSRGDVDVALAHLGEAAGVNVWNAAELEGLQDALARNGDDLCKAIRDLCAHSSRTPAQAVDVYYRHLHLRMGHGDDDQPACAPRLKRKLSPNPSPKRRSAMMAVHEVPRSLTAMMAHGLLEAGSDVLSLTCEDGSAVLADLLPGGGIRWIPEGGAVIFRSLPHFVRAMTVPAPTPPSLPPRLHQRFPVKPLAWSL